VKPGALVPVSIGMRAPRGAALGGGRWSVMR
jgi:hypothetical protein